MSERPEERLLCLLNHARLTADYKGYVELDRSDYEEAARQAKVVVEAVAGYLAQQFPALDLSRIRALIAKF